MTSIYDSVVSTLLDLQEQIPRQNLPSEPISDICSRINDQNEAFMPAFRFLTLFEDCIHKWSDAEVVVPHLRSLAIKIEATIQEIANQVEKKEVQNLVKDLKDMEEGRRSIFFLWGTNIPEKASKLLDVLTNLNAKINLLKPEIRDACEKLSGLSFQSHSPMRDFDDWKEFVSSIYSCLWDFEGEKDVRNLGMNLLNLRYFLDGLPAIPRAQDFYIHVANVSIRATLVSCQWWANQFDPNMKADVLVALSDLERKSNFTDPEALDQFLRLLKTLKAKASKTDRKLRRFVQDLLPFRKRFEEFTGKRFLSNEHLLPFTLIKELESLIISVVKVPGEDAEDEQTVIKLLISEIESFSCSLQENGILSLNLLAKFWLIMTQFLIIEELTAGGDLMLSEKKQIDALNQGVKQMKESPEEHTENLNQILILVEEVAKLVASLHLSFRAKHITRDMVRAMLFLILLKILHFKLDRKLYDSNESSTFIVEDRMQSFLEGLKFLINCFINQQGLIVKDGELEIASIEAMARRVISLYHSLLIHITAEKMININIMLSDLLDEIKLMMSKLADIHLHFPKSNFPKTNALGFFDSLLGKLRELLNCKTDLFASVKQYIEEILGDLEFFRHFVGDILKAEKGIQELRDLVGNVINVAYEAAYLIDSIVGGHRSECYNLIWLYYFLQGLRHIKMQVTNVYEKKTYDVKVHNVSQTSRHLVSKISTPRIDGDVLSLNDQEEVIIDQLVGGYPQRDTVSIVGMPGVGKTTLAKKVYSSATVVCHFHIRVWCCVTEVYRKRELLFEILNQIIVLTDNILGMSNEDLDFKLHQVLLKKKYLIVMDDVWNTEAWDDLQRCFPDDENGSRILITSRLNDVGLKANAHSDPHHLRLLSDAESWDLLRMKIFHDERCPGELIEVGQELAKNCKGLPLAIVAMAGFLKRTDRQQNRWKEIVENLSSRIADDPLEQCRDILELSYKLLPDHLKACFLYFGAFLEDQEIPVRKLIRLWIAEGFVQKTELESLEDLAEDYLKDLIGRSLVIFAQPRSRGGTKTCHIHDMLRNLCQSKAKEDNFLQVIARYNESYATFDDLDFLVNVNISNPSNYKTYEDYRLCFYSRRNHFVESRPSGPYAHSLLFFATSDKYARSSYDISFISHNFRLLKVLDLECINMGPSFPSGIELMVQLRYLGVSGDVDSVPSSIANLWNLETFVLKGLKGKVNLPDTIWCLTRLRHVHVSDVAVINLQDDKLGNSSLLDYLVTLSSPFLHYGEDTNSMLRKFPNLRKLGCIFSESPDCSGIYNLFPSLDVLTRLESLKICYYGRALRTAEFNFPLSVKKLTLSNFRLPWSHISVIGRFQNLEVLKLLSRAYDGEIWDMVEGEFHNLRFLKLDSLNIAKWNASSDNLPNLERLVLRNCKLLEEVPSSFVELSTLQMIEVQWCGKSAEESVRRMREEADEHLKVIITSDLESRSSL